MTFKINKITKSRYFDTFGTFNANIPLSDSLRTSIS